VKELAVLIKNAKHVVVYTGAGVSTSAKIPDYRGPQGVWTLRDQGLKPTSGVTLDQAAPTLTHVALLEMHKRGLVKFLVSTNVDGLHRRSGVPQNAIAELHGNCFKESCSKCHKESLRTYDCTSHGTRKDHLTGRKCEEVGCDGNLIDSIVNFGENLPESELNPAIDHSKKSDLALVLGTSMRVAPACHLPGNCFKNKGKLVICNLQNTPFDKYSTINLHAPTDIVLELLSKELEIEIPTVTEDGIPVLRPEPYNPQALRQKSLENMPKPQPSNGAVAKPPAANNATNHIFNGIRSKSMLKLENLKGQKMNVTEATPKDLLYLWKCENLEVSVDVKVTKIILENCVSTTVLIKAQVLTGSVEIIGGENNSLHFETFVPTITVDKATKCKLTFNLAAYQQRSPRCIWSECEELSLQGHEVPPASIIRPNINPTYAQFLSKLEGNHVTNEYMIREGAGYLTTEREKAENDARDAANVAAMHRTLNAGRR